MPQHLVRGSTANLFDRHAATSALVGRELREFDRLTNLTKARARREPLRQQHQGCWPEITQPRRLSAEAVLNERHRRDAGEEAELPAFEHAHGLSPG